MNRWRLVFYFCAGLLVIPGIVGAQYDSPDPGYVFDDAVVPRVDIQINPTFLGFILDPENEDSYTEYPATFYFTKGTEKDTVNKVGFRLRGNTSRASAKKSFKISFNYDIKGQKFKGLEKMNLNGEHNDPSVMRAKMCWDLYKNVGIPGSRVNHVEFYVNGEYRGLYANVEHVDEQFLKRRFTSNDGNLYKCLYPANLIYKGDNPELYKEVIYGRRAYQLQTNEEEDDYTDLARFIDILNNSSAEDFQCKLESVFDVHNYLKAIVMDILVSNWDGPIVNQNNFYLYHDPESDKFVYIPYDLDNTLGIGWGGTQWAQTDIYDWADTWGNAERPIYKKIMAVPEYRNKVSYYFEQFTLEFFNKAALEPYLDAFLEKLRPFRSDDEFAEMDYGWSLKNFEDSFEKGVANHVPLGLKEYIDERNTSVGQQLQLEDPLALFEYSDAKWSETSVEFELNIEFPWSITGEARLFYQINDLGWSNVDMNSSDQTLYTVSIPHDGSGELSYYFEIENFAGTRSYPYCDFETIPLGLEPGSHPVINELLASNNTSNVDNEGEYEDWIELYYSGTESLNLSMYFLSDNRDNPGKWQLESKTISSGEYYTVWADEDGVQGGNHANFKLSKDGEYLGLSLLIDGVYFIVDSLTFPSQETDITYGRLPNGTGEFQVLPFASFGYNNEASSGIISDMDHDKIDLYPNPSEGLLNIRSGIASPIERITIFNSMGQKVYQIKGEAKSVVFIDLVDSPLRNGTYFAKVGVENGQAVVKKFIYLNPAN